LLSFTLTAFGVMMAARIKQMQAFMALTQMLVMPLFFLSGALYPLNGLPAWLTVLTRFDPLTYIVSPMRHAVFSSLKVSPRAAAFLSPGVSWDGWRSPSVSRSGLCADGCGTARHRDRGVPTDRVRTKYYSFPRKLPQ
jgi:ABC-2 type transport system permease protein